MAWSTSRATALASVRRAPPRWAKWFLTAPAVNPPPPPLPSNQELRAESQRINGRLEGLRRQLYDVRHNRPPGAASPPPAHRRLSTVALQPIPDLTATGAPVSVTQLHRVLWEHVEDYKECVAAFERLMETHPGFLSLHRIDPPPGAIGDDATLFSMVFRFDSIANLHGYYFSEGRSALLERLETLLEPADDAMAQNIRQVDPFADVLVKQGAAVPVRPPPRYKVVLLNVMSLFLVAWPTAVHLPGKLDEAGAAPRPNPGASGRG